MNFRIVLHLYKTDWQRLKWLIVGLWTLILLLTLPQIFGSPFAINELTNGGGSGQICDILAQRGEYGNRSTGNSILYLLRLLFGNTPLISLITGGLIGFHSHALNLARPARLRETLAAKMLASLTWLTLPQLTLIVLHLCVRGFSLPDINATVLASGIAMGCFHIACVLFGMLAGTFWLWFSGILFGCALLISLQIISRNSQFTQFLNSAWSLQTDLQCRLFHAVVAMAFFLLASWSLRHWKATTRIIAALLILLLCGWGALRFDPAPTLLAKLPVDPSIQPQASASAIVANASYGNQGERRYLLNVPMGRPSGKDYPFILWAGTGEAALKTNSEVRARSTTNNEFLGSYWFVNTSDHSTSIPDYFSRPLQGKERKEPPLISKSFTLAGFPAKQIEELQNIPITLESEITGIKFRYDVVHSGAPDLSAQWKHENMQVYQRPFVGGPSRYPMIDLYAITANNGRAPEPSPVDSLKLYLYVPTRDEYLPFDQVFQANSHDHAGCRVFRRIYQLDGTNRIAELLEADRKDARVVVLAPRFLARNTVRMTTPQTNLSFYSPTNNDWYYTLDRESDAATFSREILRLRPDPDTADEDTFGRWLLRTSGRFSAEDWNTRDLAEFVPRHLETICRMQGTSSADRTQGNALALACPEQRKETVLRALRMQDIRYGTGNWIPDVLNQRDWGDAAREDLVSMFLKKPYRSDSFLQAIIRLEDPATYSGLLTLVENGTSLDLYEKIRQLPGIEPGLSNAITTCYLRNRPGLHPALDDLSFSQSRSPFQKLLIPALHGHNEAFSDLLRLWHQIENRSGAYMGSQMAAVIQFPAEVDTEKSRAIRDYLRNKSVQDFRYDSLSRRWLPL